MSQSYFYPSSSASANPSVGANGVTAPTSSTEIAGVNPGGNLTPLSVSNNGYLNVNLSTATIEIGKVDQGLQGSIGSAWYVTGTDGTNSQGYTAAGQAKIISAQLPSALGAQLMAASTSVVIASDQIVPVSGTIAVTGVSTAANQTSGGQKTQVVDPSGNSITSQANGSQRALDVGIDVAGVQIDPRQTRALTSSDTVTVVQPTGSNLHVAVDSSALPTGAATSALQTSGNSSLTTITTNTGNIPTVGQKTMAASLPVVIASDQSAIPVSGTISVTGVATAANQTGGNQKTQVVDPSGNSITSQANGSQRALDVGIDVAGVQIDPRQIRALTSADVVTAVSATAANLLAQVSQPTAANLNATVVQATGSNLHVQVDASALPTGAATSANQTNASQKTQVVDGSGNVIGSTSNALNINISSGSIANTSFAVTQATAANLNMTDAADGPVSPGTAAAKSQLGGMVYNSTNPSPTNGQQVSLQSDQFSNLEVVMPDQVLTGQSAQTATVNNILTATSGSAASAVDNYKSASVQVVSTGTGGTFIFEGSNDNVNFQTIPVFNQAVITGTPITAAITATASQIVYVFPLQMNYIRLRIATTITGGSIQAFSRFAQATWAPNVFQVAQTTAANLATTATIASGTVTTVSTVTSVSAVAALASWYTNADQASAAITTTTTSAAKTITNGTVLSLNVNITVVSGTTPTYDFQVQESLDGTVWTSVWQAPRATAVSTITSPPIIIRGQQYRYVETIGGTTPSFTRTITSNRNISSGIYHKTLIDRTLNPASGGSTSASLNTEGCSSLGMIVLLGAGGTGNIQIALDGSDDNSNWVQGLTFVNVVAAQASPVQAFYNMGRYRFIRARVATAQASSTLSYLTLIGNFSDVQVPPGRKAVTQYTVASSSLSTAYTQVVASTIADIHAVETFDSSGSSFILGVGAAASEVTQIYIFPGGGGQQPLFIPAGSRIAVKTTSGTPTGGTFFLNAYGV